MGPIAAAKLWLMFKPIKRIKNARERREVKKLAKEGVLTKPIEFTDESAEVQEVGNFVLEVVKGGIRHGATALGIMAANAGIASQDDVQAAVGAVVTLIGFGWSVWRKWSRAKNVV